MTTDVSALVIGRRYIVNTSEPAGEFRVGAFRGWSFTIAPGGGEQDPEFVTELPEGWKDRFPDTVFENGVVGDWWCFEAVEEYVA